MVPIRPIAWDPPCAMGAAQKRPKKKKKNQVSIKNKETDTDNDDWQPPGFARLAISTVQVQDNGDFLVRGERGLGRLEQILETE